MRSKAVTGLLVLAVLSFTAYLLTWTHWHPAPVSKSPAAKETARPGQVPEGSAVYNVSEFILPATLASDGVGITEEGDAGKPCIMHAGNRVRAYRPQAEGEPAIVVYLDEAADEPEECESDRVFKITRTRFDHLHAAGKILLELEQERQRAAEEKEQAERNRLGMPP